MATTLTQTAPAESTLTDQFVTAFRNHPAGVALVTADPGDGPVAMTATSVCSVDASPPTVAFSASGRASSTPSLLRSSAVVVHLLSAHQLHLAKLGATSGIDRFADTSLWDRLPTGEVVFRDAAAWIRGRVIGTLPAKGATLFLVEGDEIGGQHADPQRDTEPPLVYHSRAWHTLGSTTQLPE